MGRLAPYKHFVLGVSMGSGNHKGEAIEAIVTCLNKTHLETGIIEVSDTLARYQYIMDGMDLKGAYEKACEVGAAWEKDHEGLLEQLRADCKIK